VTGSSANGWSWADWAAGRLAEVVDGGRWRAPRTFDAAGPHGVVLDPAPPDGPPGGGPPSGGRRRVVSFASNDYLGLAAHPAVVAAAHAALDRWGAGAGASRLVTGSRPVHAALERDLATWKGTDAAVCFPTGFAANLGVLTVLGTAGVRLVSDELNHASIVDGCRLSRAAVSVYRHADPDHLDAVLGGTGTGTGTGTGAGTGAGEPAVVVTDTVFSMDGDHAPLVELAEVCRRHRAMLVLDEAHAVLGPDPGPEVTEDLVVLRVGTLSKTLGSLGGFVAGPRTFVDLLVNLARPYIFTTALSPADAAAARAALGVLRGPDGAERRTRLAGYVAQVSPGHPSPIVPVVLGSEARALEASAALLDMGIWVPAIRPPTVPVGTSRLRVTLSAAHTPDEVDRLVDALAAVAGPAERDAVGTHSGA
jgi:8-amino-7-oxononanoate synthase